MSWLRHKIDRVRYLWRRALEENADPHSFAFAVAIGTTISASPVPPVLGMRSFSTIGLAWVFRKSKLAAWMASHSFIGPMWVFAAVVEVRVGSFLLGRPPPTWGANANEKIEAARHAVLAWWLGGFVFAPLCGLCAYLIARPIHARYLARRAKQKEQEEALVKAEEKEAEARADTISDTG